MKRVRAVIKVYGVVQGVGYRAYIYRIARTLGLVGYVKNLEDGSVLIVAEGDKDSIDKLLEYASRGPPAAIVEHIDVKMEEPKNEFNVFYIDFDC